MPITHYKEVISYRLYPKNLSDSDIDAVCDKIKSQLEEAKNQGLSTGVIRFESIQWSNTESGTYVPFQYNWRVQLQNVSDFTALRDEMDVIITEAKNKNVSYALIESRVSS